MMPVPSRLGIFLRCFTARDSDDGSVWISLVWCCVVVFCSGGAPAAQWLSFVFLRSRGDAAFRSNESSSPIDPMEEKTLLEAAEVPLEAQ